MKRYQDWCVPLHETAVATDTMQTINIFEHVRFTVYLHYPEEGASLSLE